MIVAALSRIMDSCSNEMLPDFNASSSQSNNITAHEPYLQQDFDCLDDVYNFYNSYALKCGFGIRKSSTSKSRVTGECIWKKYQCDKSGFKISSVNEAPKNKVCRASRVGCPAKVEVRMSKHGKWTVTSFFKDHNHPLDTPRRTKKHKSHNISHKSHVAKSLMESLNSTGVGPSHIAKTLNCMSDGNEISSQHVIDHLKKHRQNNVGHEGVKVAEYLQAQTLNDPNFYYALELDSDGLLRSIFWADSHSRNDYITFGDVVIFDVTYKTNRLKMPFAPFTGVNHHRQSILLGCALLADETEESFIWLFQHWIRCMFGKPPSVIITDMDCAMHNAIKFVFPNTRHRFCSWHEKISKYDTISSYSVGLQYEERYKWCTVTYNDSLKCPINCECALFETDGYLCKHILHIISKKQLLFIPDKFILRRWTILSRHISTENTSTIHSVTPLMKWKLISMCNDLVTKASNSITTYTECYTMVNEKLNDLHVAQTENEDMVYEGQNVPMTVPHYISHIDIRDPQITRTKGRPKIASRIKSGIEQSQKTSKMRTCGECGGKGHYATTCPNKSKDKKID